MANSTKYIGWRENFSLQPYPFYMGRFLWRNQRENVVFLVIFP